MKKKIEIEVDIPDGYEATGEYRKLLKGEFSLNRFEDGLVEPFDMNRSSDNVIILRRIEPAHVKLAREVAVHTAPLASATPHRWHQLAKEVIAEWEASR